MKKRILATILTLSMVFSLAACGSKEETKEPAAAQTEDAAVAQEEAKPAEGDAKPLKIGGQTLVDLGISWDTRFGKQPVTLSAWCYNLLNKDYWYAAGGNNIGLGAPRTFAVSAQFNF